MHFACSQRIYFFQIGVESIETWGFQCRLPFIHPRCKGILYILLSWCSGRIVPAIAILARPLHCHLLHHPLVVSRAHRPATHCDRQSSRAHLAEPVHTTPGTSHLLGRWLILATEPHPKGSGNDGDCQWLHSRIFFRSPILPSLMVDVPQHQKTSSTTGARSLGQHCAWSQPRLSPFHWWSDCSDQSLYGSFFKQFEA